MPTKELMTWESGTKRWMKNVPIGGHRKMFAISPRKLRKLFPDQAATIMDTKDGSREAANQWLESQLALVSDPNRVSDREADAITHEALATFMDYDRAIKNAGIAVEATATKRITITRVPKPKNDSLAVGTWTKKWIDSIRPKVDADKIDPQRFSAYRRCVEIFRDWLGEDEPITIIDAEKFENFYNYLLGKVAAYRLKNGGWAPSYCNGILLTARQFVHWLAQRDLIPTPKNLFEKSMNFPKGKKKIVTFDIAEARHLIKGCGKDEASGEKTKLYLLLFFNCGMYQSDVSDLGYSEFNMKEGTITRKRSKTSKEDDCPAVTYKLWPETLRLLKKYRNHDKTLLNEDHDVRILVTAKGGPLVKSILIGNKLSKSDNIKSAYVRLLDRLKIKNRKSINKIRKTSATLLGEHPTYKFYAQYFLAQSPRGVADSHYVIPSNEEFFQALEWLRVKYDLDGK